MYSDHEANIIHEELLEKVAKAKMGMLGRLMKGHKHQRLQARMGVREAAEFAKKRKAAKAKLDTLKEGTKAYAKQEKKLKFLTNQMTGQAKRAARGAAIAYGAPAAGVAAGVGGTAYALRRRRRDD